MAEDMLLKIVLCGFAAVLFIFAIAITFFTVVKGSFTALIVSLVMSTYSSATTLAIAAYIGPNNIKMLIITEQGETVTEIKKELTNPKSKGKNILEKAQPHLGVRNQ